MAIVLIEEVYEGAPTVRTGLHFTTVNVAEVLVVTEKVRGGVVQAIRDRFGIEVKSVIRIDIEAGRVRTLGAADDGW